MQEFFVTVDRLFEGIRLFFVIKKTFRKKTTVIGEIFFCLRKKIMQQKTGDLDFF